MLVLGRRKDQSITVGDNIRFVVLGIKGTIVKIGIEAPNDTRILRTELLELKSIDNEPCAIAGLPSAD
jgi:carbon storage regulator